MVLHRNAVSGYNHADCNRHLSRETHVMEQQTLHKKWWGQQRQGFEVGFNLQATVLAPVLDTALDTISVGNNAFRTGWCRCVPASTFWSAYPPSPTPPYPMQDS